MNPYYNIVKEEYPGGGSSAGTPPWGVGVDEERELAMMTMTAAGPPPQPREGLNDTGPPPFLTKTYEMVDDPSANQVVSWSRGGGSFVVWDPHAFSTALLPRYFKHSNFSSFVRQLNTYGFRKINPDSWEFANEGFLRGQRHLLKNIKRRKTPSQPMLPVPALDACVELGRFGIDGEVERLIRDKQVLMIELVKLRQHQQNTRAYIQAMEQRLQGAEKKQQQMMSFLARAVQNPAFLQLLAQQKETRKELNEAMTKKRRRQIDQGHPSTSSRVAADGDCEGTSRTSTIKAEPFEYDGYGSFEMTELEALALEMQGYGRITRRQEDDQQEETIEPPRTGSVHKELDEGFWEELLNERFEGELHIPGSEVGDVEDVNVLADRFGYLGSSAK